MTDKIPLHISLKKGTPPRFVQVDGEWHVVGSSTDVEPGNDCMVTKYSGDEIIVHITEYIADRDVKHRGDQNFTRYVLARFE